MRGAFAVSSAVLQFPLITEGDKGVKKYEQSLEGRFCGFKRRPAFLLVTEGDKWIEKYKQSLEGRFAVSLSSPDLLAFPRERLF
ncbi:MAG: hypothetical protein MZV63_64540 [Marinilabiliales bacterium]|nr:hypothetical protein [Marinilabiliales bacterium]